MNLLSLVSGNVRWLRLALVVFVMAAGLPACGDEQAPAERRISADLRQPRGPLNRMFLKCVGAGRANEGLRADWQRQLTEVRQQCGFEYIRMHGLLSDDMGVYSEDPQGNPLYNWQYIDELYDFLQRIGMKPFVELGFMPSPLASGKQTIFWWRGNVTQPRDMGKWEGLIRAFVAHLRERYGEAEVSTWYFEVWNEPNLDAFFAGTQQDYFRLYAATARAIKSVCPRFRVGGPATAGAAWAPEFIQFCATNHSPVDFVSTHAYAVMSGYLDADGHAGTVLSPDPGSIWGDVLRVREQIAHSALPGLELHFTEWSASYTPADPIHDSYHSAAFILDKLKHVGDKAQSMSYWVFTDIFEEPGPRWTPFHGGFGLMNYQDIRKPAFFAYQFLNRLGETELATSDAASWVCADKAGGIQALVWNFTNTHAGTNTINQQFYNRDLPSHPREHVTLEVGNVPAGKYSVEQYLVGYRTNDAYTAYLDIGAPAQLSRRQVAQLKAASAGEPVSQAVVKVGRDRVLRQDCRLRDNDVFLLLIRRK